MASELLFAKEIRLILGPNSENLELMRALSVQGVYTQKPLGGTYLNRSPGISFKYGRGHLQGLIEALNERGMASFEDYASRERLVIMGTEEDYEKSYLCTFSILKAKFKYLHIIEKPEGYYLHAITFKNQVFSVPVRICSFIGLDVEDDDIDIC